MKRTIKLRESELKRMIAESVKRKINEEFKLYGPSPMTIAELTYNNQDIREHIDAVLQFCEVAAATPEAAGNPNVKKFCKKLYKDLLDFKSHAFFELDGYDEN